MEAKFWISYKQKKQIYDYLPLIRLLNLSNLIFSFLFTPLSNAKQNLSKKKHIIILFIESLIKSKTKIHLEKSFRRQKNNNHKHQLKWFFILERKNTLSHFRQISKGIWNRNSLYLQFFFSNSLPKIEFVFGLFCTFTCLIHTLLIYLKVWLRWRKGKQEDDS